MKIWRIRQWMIASILLSLLANEASGLLPAGVRSVGGRYLQESGTGAPLGKLNVAPEVMERQCVTMVSPTYPQTSGNPRRPSSVVVRVVIWRSGGVYPMRVVSGDTSLETEATNVVRFWRYKPFVRDGEPIDVTTDIRVDFDPQRPGGMVTHPYH